ncbi:MAG: hypothetical protein HZB99_02215 [Candidatus Harrisonbacteria bacterium]|nr:hypothetical protein [Candidatus Harrisonbacteria bacterium]
MKFIDVFRGYELSVVTNDFVNTFIQDIAEVAQKRNQEINASQLLTLLGLFAANMDKLNRKCVAKQIPFHCMRIEMEMVEKGYVKFTVKPVDQNGKGVFPEGENTQFYLFATEEERQELEKSKGNRIMFSIDPEIKNNPN